MKAWNVLAVPMIALMVVSCDNDDDTIVIEVTEEDVAEVIGAMLGEETGGLSADFEELLSELEEECDYLRSETVNDTEEIGSRTVSREYQLTASVNCEAGVLVSVDYDYTVERMADLLRLVSESSAVSAWRFFDDQGSYILDGDYAYTGVETFKVGDELTYETDIEVSSSTLRIEDDGDFIEGVINITYTVEASNGEMESSSGQLVVTEQNVAILDISSFEYLYEIDIVTGEVTQLER